MKPLLLLIDLQNDFLQSAGLQPPAGEVISRAAALLKGCRALSIPVIHIWTTMPSDDTRHMHHWKIIDKRACINGTEGHAPPGSLCPIGSEIIIQKFFFSAFAEGKLDHVLQSLKPDTIVIAGLHLHVCLRATILDAYQRDFRVWVVEDAVASDTPFHATITRRYLEKRTIRFLTVNHLLSLLSREPHPLKQDADGIPSLPAIVTTDGSIHDDITERIVHISPRQNDVKLWRVSICGNNQIAHVTSEAKRVWLSWRDASIVSRVAILERLVDLLKTESSELAKQMAVEVGKPVMYGQAEVLRGIELLKSSVHHANSVLQGNCGPNSKFRYRSLGVIAIITPSNNPLAIPLGKIAPALAYGNTVVWKPAPAASSIAVRLMELLQQAGCQPGLVNLICGDRSTAEILMSDEQVDAVSLTGSLDAGYSAQGICVQRHIPLQTELGGNNASIVWSDCILEEAALKVADAAFNLAGQRCTANRRIIIESRSYDHFIKYIEVAVASLVWGDPMDPKTQVGPLISVNKRNSIAALISRTKPFAETIFAPHKTDIDYEKLTNKGAYYPPTVICCNDPDKEIVQEETFGPVLVIQRASDWDHAMKLCNGVKQGLVAALFSKSKELQARFLADAQAGVLKINSATTGVGVEAPFGGWKASGSGPPEHGISDREFYTRTQAIYTY